MKITPLAVLPRLQHPFCHCTNCAVFRAVSLLDRRFSPRFSPCCSNTGPCRFRPGSLSLYSSLPIPVRFAVVIRFLDSASSCCSCTAPASFIPVHSFHTVPRQFYLGSPFAYGSSLVPPQFAGFIPVSAIRVQLLACFITLLAIRVRFFPLSSRPRPFYDSYIPSS